MNHTPFAISWLVFLLLAAGLAACALEKVETVYKIFLLSFLATTVTFIVVYIPYVIARVIQMLLNSRRRKQVVFVKSNIQSHDEIGVPQQFAHEVTTAHGNLNVVPDVKITTVSTPHKYFEAGEKLMEEIRERERKE